MDKVYDVFNLDSPFEYSYTISSAVSNPRFHFHESYEIHLLEEGLINHHVDQALYQQKPGWMIIFRTEELHKAVNPVERMTKRLVMHFNPEYVRQLSTSHTNLLDCFCNREAGCGNTRMLSEEEFKTYRRLFMLAKETSASQAFGDDLLALSHSIQLLVLVNKIYNTGHKETSVYHKSTVRPIISYIEEHFSRPLTLDMMASDLAMDKFYMSHLFKRETETTLFQYITLKRISTAKNLLLEGMSVTDVCHETGFGDYSHFIRTFKKETGYSPGQFKKLFIH